MKVTGYMLREALKAQELRRDTAANAFPGSLKKFEGEEKESPENLVQELLAAEDATARLQMAQARYNMYVTLTAGGMRMTLAEAVKRLGGVSRVEKMWRTATGAKPDRYAYASDERNPGMLVAKPTITSAAAMKLTQAAAKAASEYRAAIATANAHEYEVENLDPKLFE